MRPVLADFRPQFCGDAVYRVWIPDVVDYLSSTAKGDAEFPLYVGAPRVRYERGCRDGGRVVTMLPPGEKPWVVSPLRVVPKKGTGKFRLTVNMRYVNGHVG